MAIRVGSKVRWRSQSAGYRTEKVGTVVEVVPKDVPMHPNIACRMHGGRSAFGYGCSRDHESYVVSIPTKGKGRPMLYWPRVKQLEVVEY